jgi:rhamnogalacturonan endolyase
MRIVPFRPFAVAALALSFVLPASSALAQRVMEDLGRGVVAVHQPDGRIFVSWRLLGTDPADVAFNVYRLSEVVPGRVPEGLLPRRGGPGAPGGGGTPRGRDATADAPAPVLLNEEPLLGPTWFVDERANLGMRTGYAVAAVVAGVEQPRSAPFVLEAGAPPLPYRSIPLRTPEGYGPNDASVGDLDGDGEYELVLHQVGRSRDNSQSGVTDPPILQAYELDGTMLWEINLGKNVREGAHYTQFMVYDLDGDGRAEVVVKTADGTRDGVGHVIGDATADWVERAPPPVEGETEEQARARTRMDGRIVRGPEYLTVFDGRSGAALATVDYIPQRHPETHSPTGEQMRETWGDPHANRSDRFLAGVAYLDGKLPSVVMCRGYYTRSVLAAWDWRDGKLVSRWVFDSAASEETSGYAGQGNHSLSIADVDDDGRDEIVYGSMTIDDDGTGLYTTGLGHGDAQHVSDLDPTRPGQEVFSIHERPRHGMGVTMRDARTGEVLWSVQNTDVGRGLAANIDPRHPGAEAWSSAGPELWSAEGIKIADTRPRGINFTAWWDGDLLREILDRNLVTKWDWENATERTLLVAQDQISNNGTKATPTLSADLYGDWREEIIWRTLDGKELRVYTTTIPTPHRIVTLMHDSQYRLAVAWQNVAYNQPPHPSFMLDDALPLPPHPTGLVVAPRQPRIRASSAPTP